MSYLRFSLPGAASQTAASAATAAGQAPKASFVEQPPASDPAGLAPGSAASAATAAGQELKTDFLTMEDVLVMFERIVVQFVLEDMPRGEAERKALPVLRGALHNDRRLAPRQIEAWRCLICGEPGRDELRLLPYLSAVPGQHHWIHPGECHELHCHNQSAKVESCLRTAGLT